MQYPDSVVNRVYLDGVVEQEPELRYISNDSVEARFTLLTIEEILYNTGKVSGSRLFHKVIARGDVAQAIERSVHAGARVRIEGRIQYVRNSDRRGNAPLTTEIECLDFQLLEVKQQREAIEKSSQLISPEELDWLQWQGEHEDEPF